MEGYVCKLKCLHNMLYDQSTGGWPLLIPMSLKSLQPPVSIGVIIKACFAILPCGFLTTWPVYFHFSSFVGVSVDKSLFLILLGQNYCMLYTKH